MTSRPRRLAIVLILVTLAFLGSCALIMVPSRYGFAHPDHEWLRSLQAPDGSSCCNERDCAPSDARIEAGAWWVPASAGWEKVPPERVLRTPNRDGRPVLCRLPSGVIVCFVPPAGA